MKYVFPIVLTLNDDNNYLVEVPDLKGCSTYGDTLFEAIEMARDAASMWLCDAENKGEDIPLSSDISNIQCSLNSLKSFIDIDTIVYQRENDNKAIKKTLTIPSWLNSKAEKAGVNFSQTLQRALIKELNIG